MIDLNKIKLRHSPLSDRIFLARFGKDPRTALDKRDAEKDVFAVVTEHMMHDTDGKGSRKVYRFGHQHYEMIVRPVSSEDSSHG